MPMYTLGHGFVPPPVHAGGLRYHGDAPSLCALVRAGAIEARAFRQNETFEAALRFARTEGIIPAPEPAHAIRAVIEEAQAARESGEERVILFGLCGHGHFDLAAYDAYLAGTLEDPEFCRPTATRRWRRCRGAPTSASTLVSDRAPAAATSTSRRPVTWRQSGCPRTRCKTFDQQHPRQFHDDGDRAAAAEKQTSSKRSRPRSIAARGHRVRQQAVPAMFTLFQGQLDSRGQRARPTQVHTSWSRDAV